MVKRILPTIGNCSLRKEFAPSGSKIFPLREVPILKRDAIEEVIQCGEKDFAYHKELLLKKRIRYLWEQILSFKRSSYFKKGRS